MLESVAANRNGVNRGDNVPVFLRGRCRIRRVPLAFGSVRSTCPSGVETSLLLPLPLVQDLRRLVDLTPRARRIGYIALWVAFGLVAGCGASEDPDADGTGSGDGADAVTMDASDASAVDAVPLSDILRPDVVRDTTPSQDTADAEPVDGRVDVADVDAADDVPIEPDVELSRCGDGVVDEGEACDDGNRIDTDLCTSACELARCGDGFRNETIGRERFVSPVVTGPTGFAGYVCDDGAWCPGSTCSVENEPTAAEHGVCQGLGYERAVSVAWGGGLGASAPQMLHAYNWTCFDYLCVESEAPSLAGDCQEWEMLREIECEGLVGEACDDGSANGPQPDACREDCTLPFCGDGIVDRAEECDDANDNDNDACRNDCTLPYCGDGRLNAGEACDDGNDDDFDACRNSCQRPVCGDGVVSAYDRLEVFGSPTVANPYGATGHVCAIGASCPGGSCDLTAASRAPEHGICQSLGYERATFATWGGGAGADDPVMPRAANWACENFTCGAGPDASAADVCETRDMLLTLICTTSRGEECDEGAANDDTPGATCRRDCRRPSCGDGVVVEGEVCDDGNRDESDGCTNRCELPRCGDGFTQAGEACDDGDLDDLDACRNDCTRPVCGDGVLSEGETCDLGPDNADTPDAACRLDCTLARCGDGIVDTAEQCDDGLEQPDGICTPSCAFARCGDGIRQAVLGEQCDDGNRLDGDGCDRVCLRESSGGAGFAVYLGHDFFSTNEDVEQILGNAVFGEQPGGTIQVLAYTEFVDRSPTGEPATVDRVLNEEAARRGAAWEKTPLTRFGDLEGALATADVLLVYEQESGAARMAEVALAWADPLRDFLQGGGRVVITDYSGGTWRILAEPGFVSAASARTVSTGAELTITRPMDPLLDGVTPPYEVANGTIAMLVDEESYDYVLVYERDISQAVVLVVPF